MRLFVMYSKIDKEFHTQTLNYEMKITEKICYAHKYCTVQRKKAITSTCGSISIFFFLVNFCPWIIFTRATKFVSFPTIQYTKKQCTQFDQFVCFFIKLCTCARCSWKWHLPEQHETLYHKLRYFQRFFHNFWLFRISLCVRDSRDLQIDF